ncbi:MAG TPA: YceI family protein, partial [Bacteroidia bacterium]|nr:YceI family protein [Bacteroidia bacterium]
FSANTTIKIKNGWWFSLDKKPDGGKIILDMKSVAALQIGKDEEVETGNPEYLETKKYPTATLTILSFDSIPGNNKKLNVKATLQIKDTTGDVIFPAKVDYLDNSYPEIPSNLTGDFHIDGIRWALNPKNAKVTKDDLAFHVVLVTEKK